MSRKLSTPEKRKAMRESLWPNHGDLIYPRESEKEKGWFYAPRTLPLILALLDEQSLSGNMDLSRTYVGLLADNYGEGIIEVDSEEQYAIVAGLKGQRGVRSWRDRVVRLQALGFLTVRRGLGGRILFVLIMHPDIAVRELQAEGRIPPEWFSEYHSLWLNISGVGKKVRAERPEIDPAEMAEFVEETLKRPRTFTLKIPKQPPKPPQT